MHDKEDFVADPYYLSTSIYLISVLKTPLISSKKIVEITNARYPLPIHFENKTMKVRIPLVIQRSLQPRLIHFDEPNENKVIINIRKRSINDVLKTKVENVTSFKCEDKKDRNNVEKHVYLKDDINKDTKTLPNQIIAASKEIIGKKMYSKSETKEFVDRDLKDYIKEFITSKEISVIENFHSLKIKAFGKRDLRDRCKGEFTSPILRILVDNVNSKKDDILLKNESLKELPRAKRWLNLNPHKITKNPKCHEGLNKGEEIEITGKSNPRYLERLRRQSDYLDSISDIALMKYLKKLRKKKARRDGKEEELQYDLEEELTFE